ncbi:MAG TPA: PIG-L deacetylase family protein [Acidimicrobiia bacterium]|nr:PIG-L deacetylase family protein [Acidimicrobiia bacterium]
MRVLVIACHPDDETLGVGGTMAHHVQNGDEVRVCLLTDGVGSRHKKSDLQKECAEKACATLGVTDPVFCGLPDQGLDGLPLLDIIHPIEAQIDDLAPQIVYTHFKEDANQDHGAAFRATLVACRPMEDTPVERLLSYETASSTEWAGPFTGSVFSPNVFVDISETLDSKIDAMRAYSHTFTSEVRPYPHPRSYEAIEINARSRGVAAGMKAAEAFMLVRELNRGVVR